MYFIIDENNSIKYKPLNRCIRCSHLNTRMCNYREPAEHTQSQEDINNSLRSKSNNRTYDFAKADTTI